MPNAVSPNRNKGSNPISALSKRVEKQERKPDSMTGDAQKNAKAALHGPETAGRNTAKSRSRRCAPKPKSQAAAEKPSGLKKSDSQEWVLLFYGKPLWTDDKRSLSIFTAPHRLKPGILFSYIMTGSNGQDIHCCERMNASKRLQETSLPVFGFYHKSRNEKIYENLYHILRK